MRDQEQSMAMKIWYQSMSRFETKWKSYPKYLRRILDQVKDPDTEIEIHGITKIGGFADQYRYLEYLETGDVMENAEVQRDLIGQFQTAAKASTDAGAEVVIAAGGVVMALLAYAGVYTTPSGAPILNGITTLVKMGEMAVRLDRIMGGTFTSKRLQYAPPGPDQIAENPENYGANIYPTVKPK